MADPSVAQLIASLEPDSKRKEIGFSPDIEVASDHLLSEDSTHEQRLATINSWLEKHQPCLFGRIAARLGLLHLCILTPSDLAKPDEFLQEKIQHERRLWTRKGYEGRASGFIVIALAREIMAALPGEPVQRLAQRLASLYLLQDVEVDSIYHDETFLEIPNSTRTTWQWLCGVNYFSSNGDKRWWHDHRIPGGMAFSVNSVGHMVKSGKLTNALSEFQDLFGLDEQQSERAIDSLEKALELAMRTIAKAAPTSSGRATELLPLTDAPGYDLPCPVELPPSLAEMSHCEYRGYYHTDVTLPKEYFLPDIQKPSCAKEHRLSFTYLFDRNANNPDFITMGEGRLIRATPSDLTNEIPSISFSDNKYRRAIPEEIPIKASIRLREALEID